VFAGLDGCTDAELPAWYTEQKLVDVDDARRLADEVLQRIEH
jgi:hypothetical protein